MIYMVAFLAIYFGIYSQADNILNAMAVNGQAIAGALQTWVWPLYAMGQGCAGSFLHFLAFVVICAGAFGLIYWLLSATFLRSAATRKGSKSRRLDMKQLKATDGNSAIIGKELRRFLGCPVYLTNMGLGLILTVALTAAGILFKSTLLAGLGDMAHTLRPWFPLAICTLLAFLASTICISTPSVSLEGKNLWILKSMPISPREILLGKLQFHCMMATPLIFLAGVILAIVYGCGLADAVLCGAVPALLTVISGLLGLICDLKWTRLDWISEAYPCKQSVSVVIVMFSLMGLPVVLGVIYGLIAPFISVTVFLVLTALLLAGICFGLYRALITWGIRKWEAL